MRISSVFSKFIEDIAEILYSVKLNMFGENWLSLRREHHLQIIYGISSNVANSS